MSILEARAAELKVCFVYVDNILFIWPRFQAKDLTIVSTTPELCELELGMLIPESY